jgi:hypothetical protein
LKIADQEDSLKVQDLINQGLILLDQEHVIYFLIKDQDDQKLSMNKTGTYFNSRFKNNFSNVFGRSERPSLGLRTISPGPGN